MNRIVALSCRGSILSAAYYTDPIGIWPLIREWYDEWDKVWIELGAWAWPGSWQAFEHGVKATFR